MSRSWVGGWGWGGRWPDHKQQLGKMVAQDHAGAGEGPRRASPCPLTFPNILLTLAHIHVDELWSLYAEQ